MPRGVLWNIFLLWSPTFFACWSHMDCSKTPPWPCQAHAPKLSPASATLSHRLKASFEDCGLRGHVSWCPMRHISAVVSYFFRLLVANGPHQGTARRHQARAVNMSPASATLHYTQNTSFCGDSAWSCFARLMHHNSAMGSYFLRLLVANGLHQGTATASSSTCTEYVACERDAESQAETLFLKILRGHVSRV